MKTGLIGFGYWGPNLARVLHQSGKCEFAACCDIDPEKLSKIQHQYSSVRCFSTPGELLRSDVDAVLIATPISTHYELALEALSCRKHVFVEKPLTDSADKAQHLVDVASSKGLVLMVGHTFIYSPPVIKIKELIESGRMGDLFYISVARVNLGLYQKDVDVLWDLAVHDISILLYWLQELPVAVRSFGRACLQPHKNDVAFLWLQFPGGLVASLEVSWLSPQKLRRTSIVGSRQMIVYDDTDPSEKVRIYDRGVSLRQPESFGEFQLTYRLGDMLAPSLSNVEPLLAEVEHFADCVETGRKPLTDGEFGTDVVRVLQMAVESIASPSRLGVKQAVDAG
jgi:predicted dehydrogenase